MNSVICGAELSGMIAQYSASVGGMVTIEGGTYQLPVRDQFPDTTVPADVSSFSMMPELVSTENYSKFIKGLGANRIFVLGTNPDTRRDFIVALGNNNRMLEDVESRKQILDSTHIPRQTQYEKMMFSNFIHSLRLIYVEPRAGVRSKSKAPVTNINWFEATVFAYMHGCTLPTRWQWEYAARLAMGIDEASSSGTSLPSFSISEWMQNNSTDKLYNNSKAPIDARIDVTKSWRDGKVVAQRAKHIPNNLAAPNWREPALGFRLVREIEE